MFNKTFYRFVSLVICILMIAVSGTNLLAKSQSANVDVRPMADDSDWGAPDDGYYEYYKGYKVRERHYLWLRDLQMLYHNKFGGNSDDFKSKLIKYGASWIIGKLVGSYFTNAIILVDLGFTLLDEAKNIDSDDVYNVISGILNNKYRYAVITTVYDPWVGYKTYIDGV